MKRPRLTAKVIGGLDSFAPFLSAALEAGDDSELGEQLSDGEVAACDCALAYIRAL